MSEPVVEHVALAITPGREHEFEEAFARGLEVIKSAGGYRWSRLMRQVEAPSMYVLFVGWETLESHTVDFRNSQLFEQWRSAVGHFFDQPPVMGHYVLSCSDGDDV